MSSPGSILNMNVMDSINDQFQPPRRQAGCGWAAICNILAVTCLAGGLAYFFAYYRSLAKEAQIAPGQFVVTVDVVHRPSAWAWAEKVGTQKNASDWPARKAFKMSFSGTGATPRMAMQAARQAAEKYIAEQQAWQRQQKEALLSSARQLAEQSRQQQAQALEQLRALQLQQQSLQEDDKPAVRGPTPGKNPFQEDLQRELVQLLQHREALLLTRTPLHPAVREVDNQIDEVRQQLKVIEEQSSQLRLVPPITEATASAPNPATPDRRQTQTLLSAVVEQTREAMRELELLERHFSAGPQASMDLVVVDKPRVKLKASSYATAEGLPPWAWALIAGFGAGLIAALGVAVSHAHLSQPGRNEPPARTDRILHPLAVIPADEAADFSALAAVVEN